MVKRHILNAAIVGAGAIGSQWDERVPAEQRRRKPITHASAVESLNDCSLIAVCDNNPERLQAACDARSPVHRFGDVDTMLSSIGDQIDFLVLATPPKQREQIFSWASRRPSAPLIVCEKPVAAGSAEARSLARIARDAHLSVHVPFLRRWVPACQEVHRLIVSDSLGPLRKVTATYGKGITNNGSHLFDLLIWLFGVPASIRATDAAQDDRLHGDDPTLGCEVVFHNRLGGEFLAHVLATDHRAWTAFECDIMGQRGRLKLVERCNKLEIYASVADPDYPGYTVLQNVPWPLPDAALHPFAAMYQECQRELLAGPDQQGCARAGGANLHDALLAQAACAAAIASYEQDFAELSFTPFVKEWTDE